MKRGGEQARTTGSYGETVAVHYLRRHGYTVKERNYRAGHAEIDIVAATWRDVVFAEVKTRSYTDETFATARPPKSAVDPEKQRLTRMAARAYLSEHPTAKQPRMDVIEVFLRKAEDGKRPKVLCVRHIKAAY